MYLKWIYQRTPFISNAKLTDKIFADLYYRTEQTRYYLNE